MTIKRLSHHTAGSIFIDQAQSGLPTTTKKKTTHLHNLQKILPYLMSPLDSVSKFGFRTRQEELKIHGKPRGQSNKYNYK